MAEGQNSFVAFRHRAPEKELILSSHGQCLGLDSAVNVSSFAVFVSSSATFAAVTFPRPDGDDIRCFAMFRLFSMSDVTSASIACFQKVESRSLYMMYRCKLRSNAKFSQSSF